MAENASCFIKWEGTNRSQKRTLQRVARRIREIERSSSAKTRVYSPARKSLLKKVRGPVRCSSIKALSRSLRGS